MFYLNNGQVTDAGRRVVGIVRDSLFVQEKCDHKYKNGLSPIEMEQISELIQKSKGKHR
jgi:hypothetical protein